MFYPHSAIGAEPHKLKSYCVEATVNFVKSLDTFNFTQRDMLCVRECRGLPRLQSKYHVQYVASLPVERKDRTTLWALISCTCASRNTPVAHQALAALTN